MGAPRYVLLHALPPLHLWLHRRRRPVSADLEDDPPSSIEGLGRLSPGAVPAGSGSAASTIVPNTDVRTDHFKSLVFCLAVVSQFTVILGWRPVGVGGERIFQKISKLLVLVVASTASGIRDPSPLRCSFCLLNIAPITFALLVFRRWHIFFASKIWRGVKREEGLVSLNEGGVLDKDIHANTHL